MLPLRTGNRRGFGRYRNVTTLKGLTKYPNERGDFIDDEKSKKGIKNDICGFT